MGNYRNFELTTYFVAGGTVKADKEKLKKDIAWFGRYLKLDKVYLEAFRGGDFATEEQVRMVKETFEEAGIKVEGGITTAIPTPEGDKPKQRLFDTFCYNDPKMLKTLKDAVELTARVFDKFMIDDFFFSNCTCEACRKGRDAFNAANGIEDGSWQGYRVDLLRKISKEYMIDAAKAVNPNCQVIIKYPNWMESFQETGYDPMSQKDLFDGIYTGTETRDPLHTDQHLPRYLSYSLMTYMDKVLPGRNGGGWFDPFSCQVMDYYLEQAYLTCFAKPQELMMFCFQALVENPLIPALGCQLEKLDGLMDNLGNPIGIPCYIPNASQGEDNLQDFLGMCGFPIRTTPYFEDDADTILLTASSAYDEDILDKLDAYTAAGGKAIVTSGFVTEMLGEGIERLTSIRYRGRVVTVNEFTQEQRNGRYGTQESSCAAGITIPVLEFRNNATWGAVIKARKNEESYTLLARDTYGEGQMLTMVVPDSFPELYKLPEPVISRLRSEFEVNGITWEGPQGISLFPYDNDTFVIYSYVTSKNHDASITMRIKGAKELRFLNAPFFFKKDFAIKPLYTEGDTAVFRLNASVGRFLGYKIVR
jgi:hypothetical protein